MSSLNLKVNHPVGFQAKCQAPGTAQATGLGVFSENGCASLLGHNPTSFSQVPQADSVQSCRWSVGQRGDFWAPRWQCTGKMTSVNCRGQRAQRAPLAGLPGPGEGRQDSGDSHLGNVHMLKGRSYQRLTLVRAAYGKKEHSGVSASVSAATMKHNRRLDQIIETEPRSWIQ